MAATLGGWMSTDLDAGPLRQLSAWLDAARAAGQPMPEAMTLASATSDGVPPARLVVLRGLRRGLVFFTDCQSGKGAELAANPRAAAVLHWLVPAHRQVRVAGPVEPVSQDQADEYWSTRGVKTRHVVSSACRCQEPRDRLRDRLRDRGQQRPGLRARFGQSGGRDIRSLPGQALHQRVLAPARREPLHQEHRDKRVRDGAGRCPAAGTAELGRQHPLGGLRRPVGPHG
jgi:pyridoxine/pyridoxamine 5'-phosphate oxidase